MTKVTMPDPVAWATPDLSKFFGENEMQTLEHLGGSREKQKTFLSVPLITTHQAEAYANARVGQALEEAAKIPRAYAEEIDNGLFGKRYPEQATAIFNASTNMADRIRALIPKENE